MSTPSHTQRRAPESRHRSRPKTWVASDESRGGRPPMPSVFPREELAHAPKPFDFRANFGFHDPNIADLISPAPIDLHNPNLDILNVPERNKSSPKTKLSPKERALKTISKVQSARKLVLSQLELNPKDKRLFLDSNCISVWKPNLIVVIKARIDQLNEQEKLVKLESNFRSKYHDLFADELPHVRELPEDIFHELRLKDASIEGYRSTLLSISTKISWSMGENY